MKVTVLHPLRVRLKGRDLRLRPGEAEEVSDALAVQLLTRKPDTVRPVIEAGDWAEWLSPALPKQGEEVLVVYDEEGTFMVFHPLTRVICKLPMAWITRVVPRHDCEKVGLF